MELVSSWLNPKNIGELLPGVSVHVVIDILSAKARSDYDVNVFCSVEPPEICPEVHKVLANREWCSQWNVIIASSLHNLAVPRRVTKLNLNSVFWVLPPDLNEQPKTFGISTIMSSKKYAEGHKLRHWLRDNWNISTPTKIFHGSEPASPDSIRQPYPEDRRDCFQHMFHLVIENCRYPGYYTEKLMDAFRSRCVPVYWGAPDIADYFDVSGMILVGHLSEEEILKVVGSLTPEDYHCRTEAIARNADTAEKVCVRDSNECEQGLTKILRDAQTRILNARA
jgi:hypothetical protein